MKKKSYNWHFWIEDYKIQVVIKSSSYSGAVEHFKRVLSYHNRPAPKFKFQFGQKI